MHETLTIAAWFAPGAHMPSLTTLLISLPILGFLLFVGTRSAFKSSSASKPADRVLTTQIDDKGVPVFFDLSTKDNGAFKSARAVSRTRAPRR